MATMDRQVVGLGDLTARVENALARISSARIGSRLRSEEEFAASFMQTNTEFDSFEAFCEQSPWPVEDISDLQGVPRDRLDAYVDAQTDFETWEAMRTQAAEERIIEQIQA